jgi:hypothetical protein
MVDLFFLFLAYPNIINARALLIIMVHSNRAMHLMDLK